jgi:hypothetical protein
VVAVVVTADAVIVTAVQVEAIVDVGFDAPTTFASQVPVSVERTPLPAHCLR